MKKLLLFIVLFAGVFSAHAQWPTSSSVYLPLAAGDTLTNSGTVTKKLQFTKGYSGAAIQVYYKKISGTNAGTIILQRSLYDGDYRTTTDTLKLTSDSVLNITIPNPVYTHYMLLGTGSGTMSGVVRLRVVGRLTKQE